MNTQSKFQENPEQKVQSQEKPEFNEYVTAAKAAFARIWHNKWLWFWGIFLPMGAGFSANFNMGNNDFGEEQGTDGYAGDFIATGKDFLQENIIWIILLIALVIVLNIFIWIISAIARSGVIQAIHQMQQPSKAITFKFKDVWRKGKKDVLKIITIDVLIFVGIFLIVLILATPVALLGLNGNIVGAVVVGILAFILIIPIMILAGYLKQMGAIIGVLSGEKAKKSIENGYVLVSKNVMEALKILLINFVLRLFHGFVVFGAIIAVAIVGAIIFVFMGVVIGGYEDIFSNIQENIGVMIVAGSILGVLILIFIGASLIIKGFFSLWHQDVWVWWVKRLGGVVESEKIAFENEKEKIPKSETAPSTNISSRK